MLLRVHDPERGASTSEYAAVLVLVAAIFVAVAMPGFADRPAAMLNDALDRITGASVTGDAPSSGGNTSGGGDNDSDGSEEDGGGGESSGGGDDDNDEDDGDDGCGWNLVCHGDNAADSVGNGFSNAWEWTTETAAPQVGGFFVGLGGGIWGDITGIGDIFTTHPIDTVTGMWEGVKEDPWSLLISQEARESWSNDDYGEAIGAGTWDIGSWFLPGVGWAAKAGKLGKFGRYGNDGNDGRDDEDRDSDPCADNSFVPRTPVLAADGSVVPIEDIEVGDEVWAFDPATGEEGPREVTHLIDGVGKKTLVDITLTDTVGDSTPLTATSEHPFWDPESAEWVNAIDLDVGTWLRTYEGTWARVTAIDTRTAEDQQVHNLAVGDLHTYYVVTGTTPVLAHNSGSCTPEQLVDQAQREISEGARGFKNDKEGNEYGQENWDEYIRNLPDENREALGFYSESGAYTLNAELRRGDVGSGDPDVDAIDEALSGNPLKEDIVVQRTTNLDHIDLHPSEMKDKTFTEEGYMSTSLGGSLFDETGDAVMNIRAPEGTPGAYMDSITAFPGEQELLLGRGLEYRVVEAVEIDGQWQIYAEILPSE